MLGFLLKNPIAFLAAKCWRYAGKRRPVLVIYTLMFIASMSVELIEPYVIGKIINSVQTGVNAASISPARLWTDISSNLYLYFFLKLIFWTIHGPARVIERYTAFHVAAAYKKHLFSTVTQLSVQWHRQHHSGESIDKIYRATLALRTFLENSFQVIYMTMRLIGPLAVLFFINPLAGWIGLLTAGVAFANIYLWDLKLYQHYFQINRMENLVASAVHDYITNIASVITLHLEPRVVSEVTKRIFAPLAVFKRNIVSVEIKWFITTMLIAAMMTAVLLAYAHLQISSGHVILGGTFYTLFEYLRRIGQSFFDFAGLYGTIVRQAADVESADTIFAAHVESEGESTDLLPSDWKEISISELNFRYCDERKRSHHLKDVSLRLSPGLKIAVVGESGSGKSTLLSLLRGLDEPQSVTVTCDGTALPGKLAHLITHTTLIPQDPEIFADTIRFNLTFGLDANDEEIMEAVRLACFHPVLSRLPKGLDTNIAEKGVNLSGGEKQRLALARGMFFAKDSDILLLDESTSSVDSVNEQLIYRNIFSSCAGKCIISSVHKLHLLSLFDTIYVFDEGCIVEQGTFEQLQASGGILQAMWKQYQEQTEEQELSITERRGQTVHADGNWPLLKDAAAEAPKS